MKLALIRRNFSAVGGAELYLQRLLGALLNGGHEIHLFAETWESSSTGLKLHRVPVSGSKAKRIVRFAEQVKALTSAEQFDCIFSLERTLQQDIYRAGDGVHKVWLERRKQFTPWWRNLWRQSFHRAMLTLEKGTFAQENTRFIIVNSEMVKNEVVSNFSFPEDRIVLVRNGIDVARFRSGNRVETREKYGLSENDFVCLFVGTGWERKGLKHVIKAVDVAQQRLRSEGSTRALKLLVVGRGQPPRRASHIIYTGGLREVEHLYAAADLFTFVPIYEPSANACIEALAAGLPVITSKMNGAGELISSSDIGAVLDDPSDINSIANEIVLRVRIGARRVQVNEELISLSRNVRETLAVVERAAAERSWA
jgi:UDP-glucose:(heptosyl)LPS alpha-1,3-glucosyltransferase